MILIHPYLIASPEGFVKDGRGYLGVAGNCELVLPRPYSDKLKRASFASLGGHNSHV